VNLCDNFKADIVLLKKAIWFENTHLTLHSNFRDGLDWSKAVSKSVQESETEVEAMSIDTLLEKYSISQVDVLKIDIEGAEREVFLSNDRMEFLKVCKCIIVEIHDEIVDRQAIDRVLRNAGFVIFDFDELTVGINNCLNG